MKKPMLVFAITAFVGVIGIFIGASMNLEGYLGIIFAIAAIGAFIVSSIENNKSK